MFVDLSSEDRITRLIAHRGVHQIYTGENRSGNTCRAESVEPFKHQFIENTIPSMRAAFDYGADVVELDIHLTTDDVFAVFHDWQLECQTDGEGVTHKQSFEYLQSLDIGFGFSSDDETYPLRGIATNRMPSLTAVFESELAGRFLVNFKSGRKSEGIRFVELVTNSGYQNRLFGVYGGAPPTRFVTENIEEVRGFDRSSLKDCLLKYFLIGWTGKVPTECVNRIVAIPMNYAPLLWGWPHKFTDRMKGVNTEVILWGPYDGSGFSSGIDDEETLSTVPDHFDGYIWTNKIETIGPLIKKFSG